MTQVEYIDILFGDLGFSLAQRKDWLERRYGCRYTDELNAANRSLVIDTLTMLKAERKNPARDEEDEED